MPPALAAAALGYSPETAEHHAAAADQPWADYAAVSGTAVPSVTHRPHRDFHRPTWPAQSAGGATVAARLWHWLGDGIWVRSPLGEQIPPLGVFGLIDLAAGEPLVQGAQRSDGPADCRCRRWRRRCRVRPPAQRHHPN